MRRDFAEPPGEGRYRGGGDGPYSTGASGLVGEEDNIRQKMLHALAFSLKLRYIEGIPTSGSLHLLFAPPGSFSRLSLG